jgi:hypothetical protein
LKLLLLASAGGEPHRRALAELVASAAREHDVRVLAPDAEAKLLRPLGVPVECWRPSGLFSMLRSVGVLRRAVERDDPELIHAIGWTAAAVGLGALAPARAERLIVTLLEPLRPNEIPRPFRERRLPELLGRAARFRVPNASLAAVLEDELGVDPGRVELLPLAGDESASGSQRNARNEG